ncbi:PAAR domain-containing protein [Pseudomonas sp. LS-2]|jgi:uncharacterized Zn-binding protein involved in type VI secretion|uniref:PAAR domain-containing protein n=1 Tax=Pseudomonas sp. LS-2 TaxID=2315859 RepID=UPI000E724D03|nr:PAAR domain-containing protein [Pseudomonas sp. LS-2]RJX74789.1 PAAR domain-containing protein [Pseudomonas sp. LS-2]
MRSVIREGDKLSSGGGVITASSGMTFNGIKVACVGDPVYCPLPGHGANAIAEGDGGSTYQGREIALHGHRCECGCTLISSLPWAGRI